jgi:hypothetical protein
MTNFIRGGIVHAVADEFDVLCAELAVERLLATSDATPLTSSSGQISARMPKPPREKGAAVSKHVRCGRKRKVSKTEGYKSSDRHRALSSAWHSAFSAARRLGCSDIDSKASAKLARIKAAEAFDTKHRG